uniref:B3 domain-containing protein n=1 Tax=Vitis vinifera TaxID=29760 RepID=A5BBP8_VITVI|nr:hypothetical protein VITISV_027151 [Vitis vinifera]
MSKTITASDVDKGESRLLFTKAKVLWRQLSEEERMELRRRGYVEVEVVDPRGNRHEMKLSHWPAVRNLVLNSGWNNLVRDNNLEAGIHSSIFSHQKLLGVRGKVAEGMIAPASLLQPSAVLFRPSSWEQTGVQTFILFYLSHEIGERSQTFCTEEGDACAVGLTHLDGAIFFYSM